MDWNSFLNLIENWKPLSDWIASLAAFTAVIFAWLGYRNLLSQLKELKRQNNLNEEKLLRSSLPIFKLEEVESKGDLILEYQIRNDGLPAYEFSLCKVLPDKTISLVEKIDVLETGNSCKFSVDHKKDPSVELTLYYRNYFFDCYKQKAGLSPGDNAFEDKIPYILPPVRIDQLPRLDPNASS